MVEVGGNSSANSIYEAFIPEGYAKPGPDASHELRAKFIRLDMIYYSLSHTSVWHFSDISVCLFTLYLIQIMYLVGKALGWILIWKCSNYYNHPPCCPTFHYTALSCSYYCFFYCQTFMFILLLTYQYGRLDEHIQLLGFRVLFTITIFLVGLNMSFRNFWNLACGLCHFLLRKALVSQVFLERLWIVFDQILLTIR